MPDVSLPVALAGRVRAAPARAGSTRVVAVDGPSGAGKSSLATALAGELSAQVVPIDDLIPGWDGVAAGPAIMLRDVVQPLSLGRDGAYRRYDWLTHQYAELQAVPLADVVVLDGCGCGSRGLAPYLSLLVWVDAPRELRFERGIARDGDAFRPHWAAWERDSQALFAAEGTAARADVVIDGTVRL
jgi:dephospho-CoA kinase